MTTLTVIARAGGVAIQGRWGGVGGWKGNFLDCRVGWRLLAMTAWGMPGRVVPLRNDKRNRHREGRRGVAIQGGWGGVGEGKTLDCRVGCASSQ
jgi:hypothetical protein